MTTEYFGPLRDPAFGIGDRFDYDRFKRWIEGQPLNFKRSLTIQGDLISANWNGASPLDLSSGPDSTATTGYALDASAGAGQFASLYVGGANTDGEFMSFLAPSGGSPNIRFDDEDGAQAYILFAGDADSGSLTFYAESPDGNDNGQISVTGDSDGSDTEVRLAAISDHNTLIRAILADGQFKFKEGASSSLDGTESKPIITFENDTDTGIWRSSANRLTFSAGATKLMEIVGPTANSVRFPDGTEGTPGISWLLDFDTGFSRSGANTIAGIGGGTAAFEFTSIRFYNEAAYNDTTGAAANAVLAGGGGTLTAVGRSQRSTSALKYKSELEDADWLADIELRPMKFYRKDDKRYYYGFIADWLGEQDELLGEYTNDEIENYDQRAVMAVMAAKINRIEKKLKGVKV